MELICGNRKILIEDVAREYSTVIYRISMLRLQNKSDAEEEREELLSKIEQMEKLEESPENSDKAVSYTLVGETTISVQIVDDKYLIIDDDK